MWRTIFIALLCLPVIAQANVLQVNIWNKSTQFLCFKQSMDGTVGLIYPNNGCVSPGSSARLLYQPNKEGVISSEQMFSFSDVTDMGRLVLDNTKNLCQNEGTICATFVEEIKGATISIYPSMGPSNNEAHTIMDWNTKTGNAQLNILIEDKTKEQQ